MRTKLTAALCAALAAGALVLATATPAPAGGGPTITVTKVVSGPETAGASYVVSVSCIGSGGFTGNNPNGALNYPAGGGSQVFTLLPAGYEGDCTFIESTASGATPAYACAVVAGQEGAASCTTPNGSAPSTLNVNDPNNGPLATITVTNTFAAAAESVVADPSGFTG